VGNSPRRGADTDRRHLLVESLAEIKRQFGRSRRVLRASLRHRLDCAPLVQQVTQHHRGQSRHHRHRVQAGGVAAVVVAGAHFGVVLLQHGGVALPIPGVRDPAAAADDPDLITHVLVDLPAHGVVLLVAALLQELVVRLDLAVLVGERVGAEGVLVAVALVALEAASCKENFKDFFCKFKGCL